MSAPNILNSSSIIGKTVLVTNVAITTSTVISSVTANHVYKLNSILVSNKTASSCWISLYLTRSSTNYYLVYQIPIPANATLNVITKDSTVYLEESDVLTAVAQTASSLDIVAGYEDIS